MHSSLQDKLSHKLPENNITQVKTDLVRRILQHFQDITVITFEKNLQKKY